MTSLTTLIDIPTEVYVCENCAHVQSPNLPDVKAFYDTEYKISLQSDDHDQLYETKSGVPIFRTAHQAGLVLDLELPEGANILDFGAAKATTLRAVVEKRPDLVPHVFDVSNDYREHWSEWVAEENQATYELPEDWRGRFQAITAHFVIEHVDEPVKILKKLAACLAPGGQLFFSVPDPLGNSGDLLVVDHLNHFTEASLRWALRESGMHVDGISQTSFRGAHCVRATRLPDGELKASEIEKSAELSEAKEKLQWWADVLSRLEDGKNFAIYGAGFYGTLISSRLKARPICFLDRNPHLQGQTHVGRPVLSPEDCPEEVELIYSGLNPDHARAILETQNEWMPAKARISYLAV